MFVRSFIKGVLFSALVYHTQAASAAERSAEAPIMSAKAVDIPSVTQQIADWERIFDAHKGQDLTTVPMPELMDKVHQTVAYVTPVIQDTEAQAILSKYIEEVTAAHATNTLTFSLYASFTLGVATLMNPEKWKIIAGSNRYFDPTLASLLKNPLASEEWLGWEFSEQRRSLNDIVSMLQLATNPLFILCRTGHFGYDRIVRGYLTDIPYHVIGFPLGPAMAHGTSRTVLNFINHDTNHGRNFTETFKRIAPLIRDLLTPVYGRLSVDPVLLRRDMAGLYFLLHETGGLAEELYYEIQKNLEIDRTILGQSILEVAKRHFKNEFLQDLFSAWSGIFVNEDSMFSFEPKSNIEFSENILRFKGCIHHGKTTTMDGGFLVPYADLEYGLFTIQLPSFPLEGEYIVEFQLEENYMERLEICCRPEVYTYYKRALAAFYKKAVSLEEGEGKPKKFKVIFKPLAPYTSGHPTFLQNLFDGSNIDEIGTAEWIRTGKYRAPEKVYDWSKIQQVRTFFDQLFTDLQRDWGAIWATQPPLDPALVASTREALDAYFAEGKDGSAEGDARVGMASMPAERDDAPAAGAGASVL